MIVRRALFWLCLICVSSPGTARVFDSTEPLTEPVLSGKELLERCVRAAARKDSAQVVTVAKRMQEKAEWKQTGKAWFQFGTCLHALNHPAAELAFREALKKPEDREKYEVSALRMLAGLHFILGNFSKCVTLTNVILDGNHTDNETIRDVMFLRGRCALSSGAPELVGPGTYDIKEYMKYSHSIAEVIEAAKTIMQFVPEMYKDAYQWLTKEGNRSGRDLFQVGQTLMLFGQNESEEIVEYFLALAAAEMGGKRGIVKNWMGTQTSILDEDDPFYSSNSLILEPFQYIGRQVKHIMLQDAELEGRYGIVRDNMSRYMVPHYDYMLPLEVDDEGVAEFGREELNATFHGASLVHLYCENYGDFLLNGLTRLAYFMELLNSCNYTGLQLIVCARGTELTPWLSDALDIMKIDRGKLVYYTGHGKTMPVQRLHVIDWTRHPDRENNKGLAAKFFPAQSALIRTRLLFAKIVEPTSLVFARRSKNRIAVGLEKSLTKMAARYSIQYVSFENLSLSETITLIGSCAILVGVHGAGLANAIFMAPRRHLVELSLPQKHARYFAHLAAALDMYYWSIPLEGHVHLYTVNVYVERKNFKDVMRAVIEVHQNEQNIARSVMPLEEEHKEGEGRRNEKATEKDKTKPEKEEL